MRIIYAQSLERSADCRFLMVVVSWNAIKQQAKELPIEEEISKIINNNCRRKVVMEMK